RLGSTDQIGPDAPPAFDSDVLAKDLAEIKSFARTPASSGYALWVQYGWFGVPGVAERAVREVSRRVFEEGLEDNPWAARSYALVMATFIDAWLSSQDAKYTYWQIRPFQADGAVTTVFPTPNNPSYPSNRSVLNAAPALVMGYLFPRDAARLWKDAEKAGESAIWAGVHTRRDVEAGREMGHALAKIAIDWDSK